MMMSRVFWQTLQFSSAAVGAALLLSNQGMATEVPATSAVSESASAVASSEENLLQQLKQYSGDNLDYSSGEAAQGTVSATGSPVESNPATADPPGTLLQELNQYSQVNFDEGPLEQVNSVTDLSDVAPTDWAFQALRSLAERYQCLLGYDDGTYRGNRAMTRYEFAASLNACLLRIQEIIDSIELPDNDLSAIEALLEEFGAELATLRGRVDAIEVRVAELEANQFSTTTKLGGDILFAIADSFGDGATQGDRSEFAFGNRVRLTMDTSFTGEDRLRTRLQSANMPGFRRDVTETNMTRLSFDTDTDNAFEIDEIYYRFPLGDRVTVQIDAANVEFYDALVNPYSPLESSNGGALSRFGRFNPVLRQGSGGAGLNIDYQFSDAIGLNVGYIAPDAATPTARNGLFDGEYAALAQLNITPTDNIGVGITYINSYYPGGSGLVGSTGSSFANNPFGGVATSANTVSAQGTLGITDQIELAGWFGWVNAQAKESSGGVSDDDNATILNWAAMAVVNDVGKDGSYLAFLVGQPPKVTDNDFDLREDTDTSLHFEALYRYRLSSNIEITPGFFLVTNAEHNEENDTVWVGTIRTRFKF